MTGHVVKILKSPTDILTVFLALCCQACSIVAVLHHVDRSMSSSQRIACPAKSDRRHTTTLTPGAAVKREQDERAGKYNRPKRRDPLRTAFCTRPGMRVASPQHAIHHAGPAENRLAVLSEQCLSFLRSRTARQPFGELSGAVTPGIKPPPAVEPLSKPTTNIVLRPLDAESSR